VVMLVPQVTGLVPNLVAVPRTLQINGKRLFLSSLSGEALVGRAVIPKSLYLNAAPISIQVALPDSLMAWPVDSLVSGSLAAFPMLPLNPVLDVTMNGDGPHAVSLARRPVDIDDAAALLERALQATQGTSEAFKGARVTSTNDAKLVIVPGQLKGPVVTALDATSTDLKLNAADGATTPKVYLSGDLDPFPVLSNPKPALRLTVGAVTHDVSLQNRPTSLEEAAAMLETSVRGFPEPEFAGARFAVLDRQVLFVPGAAGAVVFDKIPVTDPSSVVELGLFADTLVRVRVNGAESLDNLTVKLTP